MSQHTFDDDCPGCRPVLLDLQGKPFPKNHEAMVVLNKLWEQTTREEREAFHQVTCLNNRAPSVVTVAMRLTERFNQVMKARKN
jgi:hypothetical protein